MALAANRLPPLPGHREFDEAQRAGRVNATRTPPAFDKLRAEGIMAPRARLAPVGKSAAEGDCARRRGRYVGTNAGQRLRASWRLARAMRADQAAIERVEADRVAMPEPRA